MIQPGPMSPQEPPRVREGAGASPSQKGIGLKQSAKRRDCCLEDGEGCQEPRNAGKRRGTDSP